MLHVADQCLPPHADKLFSEYEMIETAINLNIKPFSELIYFYSDMNSVSLLNITTIQIF